MSSNVDRMAMQEIGLIPGLPVVRPVEPSRNEHIMDNRHLAELIERGYAQERVVEDAHVRNAHQVDDATGRYRMNIWGAALVGLTDNVARVVEWSRQVCAIDPTDQVAFKKAFGQAVGKRLGYSYSSIVHLETAHGNAKLRGALELLTGGKMMLR